MSHSESQDQASEPGVNDDESTADNVHSLNTATDRQKSVNENPAGNIDLIMDIPVTVSMELGRTRISIRELLALNPGAVIELQRLASDPMEILVNGTLVAHGEAVKVGEKYGVRLTSVVSASDRLKHVSG